MPLSSLGKSLGFLFRAQPEATDSVEGKPKTHNDSLLLPALAFAASFLLS